MTVSQEKYIISLILITQTSPIPPSPAQSCQDHQPVMASRRLSVLPTNQPSCLTRHDQPSRNIPSSPSQIRVVMPLCLDSTAVMPNLHDATRHDQPSPISHACRLLTRPASPVSQYSDQSQQYPRSLATLYCPTASQPNSHDAPRLASTASQPNSHDALVPPHTAPCRHILQTRQHILPQLSPALLQLSPLAPCFNSSLLSPCPEPENHFPPQHAIERPARHITMDGNTKNRSPSTHIPNRNGYKAGNG